MYCKCSREQLSSVREAERKLQTSEADKKKKKKKEKKSEVADALWEKLGFLAAVVGAHAVM